MLRIKPPTNEEEFEEMMEIVDRHLRESNVPPHARPLRGWSEISGTLKLGLSISREQNRDPVAGRYDGDDLTIRIFQWFDRQYGDKIKISFGPGRIFILLRHDPWIMELPKTYGSGDFFASATESSSKPEAYLKRREIPDINVVESIRGLTDSMKASLQPSELNAILEHFFLGLYAMSSLEEIASFPMVREAQSDIEAAVQHAVGQTPHYGQSKWSSLQAAEKICKVFLVSKQKSYPKHHRLKEIAKLAEAVGLPAFEHGLLDAVQCHGGIRYGEEPTTAAQAFIAHVACLKIVLHVASSIQVLPSR